MTESAMETKSNARWWDGLAGLLLLCSLITAATRLVVTQWTEDLQIVQSLALAGGILGLALGQSRFSARAVFYFALGYGLPLITWHLGVGLSPFMPWKERLVVLSQRLTNTIELFTASKPVNDNILFLVLMSILFWGLSVHAGYSITRWAGAWRAAIPTGLAIMVIHAYDPLIARRAWFLAAYLLFALLLVARSQFLRQRSLWRKNRTYIPPDIGFDWIRYTLAATLFLIMFAWTAPAVAESLPAARSAWHRIKQPWDDFTDRASNAFNSLQASVGLVYEQYGGVMPLSRGTELTETLIMTINAPPRPVPGMRYYWRAYTYDHYEDGAWSSTFEGTEIVNPDNQILSFPEEDERVLYTFQITPEYSILTLYTPSQPVSVGVPARVLLEKDDEGYADLASITALSPILPGQSYEVQTALSTVTIAQLREAGMDYPDWVLERYLQLPDNITERTQDLAEQIAADLDNPYDIAAAVTEFLRGYEYREIIDAPPIDQEINDWWLFDYQAGFCQYYASAQIVMLRSLGIPARMAVGYAQGEYVGLEAGGPSPEAGAGLEGEDISDLGGVFRVRSRESHAWPEVFFPGYGWIEFEPTAAQNPIFRPRGENPVNDTNGQTEIDRLAIEQERLHQLMDDIIDVDQSVSGAQIEESSLGVFFWVIAAPIGLALAMILVWRYRKPINLPPLPVQLEKGMKRIGLKPPSFLKRWSYFATLSPLSKAYMEINRSLRWLGSPPAIDDTPSERATALAEVLPATAPYVKSLLAEYQLSVYSQKQANAGIARNAASEIRKLTYRALLQALISGREEAYSRVGS
jgi:transglutaminase-like putative cysteine protease